MRSRPCTASGIASAIRAVPESRLVVLSFRSRLLASHLAVVLFVSTIAFVSLDRWLTGDLVHQLDQRLEDQGHGAIEWAEGGRRHPDRIANRIAHIVDAEVTLFDRDGSILGASTERARTDLGPEIAEAIAAGVGKASRVRAGEEVHYVAVKADDGTLLRLAQPLAEITRTIAEMRRRLLFAGAIAVLAAVLLALLASRVVKERIVALEDEGDRLQRLMTVHRDFVANVSHELRTPITSIQGYAETLLRKETAEGTTRQFLEVIFRQSARIGGLVEQLLALSELEARSGAVARERVELLTIAQHVAETMGSRAAARGTTITLDVAEELVVDADPEGLERAVLNLVDNAVKYGRERGQVRLGAAQTGVGIEITVSDDGPGIEAPHLPRLFERFYRVDAGRSRDRGGAGLGLAIVKHLVESMDGTILVTSEVGAGTRFTITLPRTTA